MDEKLNPRWIYKADGIPANLTRGAFHAVFHGRFIGYEHELPADKIAVMIETCPVCDAGAFFATLTELRNAQNVIACEYCETLLHPAVNE